MEGMFQVPFSASSSPPAEISEINGARVSYIHSDPIIVEMRIRFSGNAGYVEESRRELIQITSTHLPAALFWYEGAPSTAPLQRVGCARFAAPGQFDGVSRNFLQGSVSAKREYLGGYGCITPFADLSNVYMYTWLGYTQDGIVTEYTRPWSENSFSAKVDANYDFFSAPIYIAIL